ncbi:MAG TPA: valine--tRNA ligase [Candidatus Saccharimonadales bacterium]|nr:valine--tRNA ligase [Candidatus Saccharimonadales bacterium]
MKLSSAYEPADYESDIYSLWEKAGVFKADPKSSKPHFSISMPPPNETGSLHAGHAIFLTLQDLMARHARQTGKDVLWLPGTDHAALAVNALMEKRLAEQGTSREKIGREEFLRQTREFVSQNRGNMNAQIKAMGSSVDWSRARYTLDEALNRCVNETFVKMYDRGLIYRGHRIVNWDPKLQTVVSDDEVVYKEEKAPFYTLQFGPFQIGTARPETKFGDKYVVMHPDDERYKHFKDGDTFECEWINGKITATVVKDEAIDPEFGTGVMTITPWHDHTDFEIAERHGLEKEQIIDFDGKLLPIAGEFAGQGIDEARPKIVEKLQAKGLMVDIDENYIHNVAINDRGKGVIEPQIRLQWFVDVNRPAVEWKGQLRSLKEVMRAVIDDEDIRILPTRFEKVYFHWIDNLRDWCISRQIWWGHRIPVWYKAEERYVGVNAPEGEGWQQDPDTLDTWFSSALWTWSTLIDQDLAKDFSLSLEDILAHSLDFQTYHPTSVMETGWDILFFWVARMILATTFMTGQVPFKTVYLHGLVRTEAGKKMSKSDPEGNVDPVEIISEYGADALRLALISGVSAGNDQRLGKGRIIASRNFCNKLWNIARYIETNASGDLSVDPEPKTVADHWILNKLSIVQASINRDVSGFKFGEAYDTLYHFIWDDLADWYIEASKAEQNQSVLAYALKTSLLLAHPFAPFVTEAIWQQLGWGNTVLAAIEQAKLPAFDQAASQEFEDVKEIVTEARRIAKTLNVPKPDMVFESEPLVAQNKELILRLAKLGSVREVTKGEGLRLTSINRVIWLDIDKTKARDHADKLAERVKAVEVNIANLESRLANKSYAERAPAELVGQTKAQLKQEQDALERLNEELAEFKALGGL